MKTIGHVGLVESAARDWADLARRVKLKGVRVFRRAVRAGGVSETLWVVVYEVAK